MQTDAGSIIAPTPRPALAVVADYLRNIYDYRHFWLCLVRSDLRRRYRRSVFGVGWSLLQPILMSAALTLVYSRLYGLTVAEFAPMVLTGLAVWNYIHGITTQGCTSLVNAEGYIRQQALPMAIFPLRTVLMLGFHFLISLGLALAFVWIARGFGNIFALWSLIPTLILLFLFGWAVATITGFIHVYFSDTQHFMEVFLQLLFFLTPIMYPQKLLEDNGLADMTRYNPVARLVNLVRMTVVEGQVPTLFQYSLSALLVGCIVLLAVGIVSRYERRLVFAL